MDAAVQLVLERRRTGWDGLFGALTMVAGVVVLAHVGLATTVSALFLGWMLLVAGIVLIGAAVLGWTDPARRWNLAFGVVTGVLGAGFVANPTATLATLTWVAGSLLLLGGVLRLVLAFQPGTPTAVLLYGGTVGAVLGLLLLLAWPGSARWFLGAALGVQLLLDGASTLLVGQWRLGQAHAMAVPTSDASDQPATTDEPAAEPASEG
ncbi:MAG: HdeD family acid-resistance protein [Nitriliruptoraceae bacterium]